MDNYPISSNSLGKFYNIDGDQLGQQYKEHLSDYGTWDQKEHAQEWLLYPHNIGPYLSIDETALSNGDLYTVLTNKEGKGKKGTLIAMVEGTEAQSVIEVLTHIPEDKRKLMQEVTLDMAGSMNKIVKLNKITYIAPVFSNGDTRKQLLARSRYLLFKSGDKWTQKQKARAKILFEQDPDIKKAYSLTHTLRIIFSTTETKGVAYTRLARWFNDVTDSGFKSFNTISATVYEHYPNILNFFDHRSTNASAESFNAKIKTFRATQRGVTNILSFLFRLAKIYA